VKAAALTGVLQLAGAAFAGRKAPEADVKMWLERAAAIAPAGDSALAAGIAGLRRAMGTPR
jgi:hypothetical protein